MAAAPDDLRGALLVARSTLLAHLRKAGWEDEARDEAGKWTSGGNAASGAGTGGKSGTSTSYDKEHPPAEGRKIHGVELKPWSDPPTSNAGWEALAKAGPGFSGADAPHPARQETGRWGHHPRARRTRLDRPSEQPVWRLQGQLPQGHGRAGHVGARDRAQGGV